MAVIETIDVPTSKDYFVLFPAGPVIPFLVTAPCVKRSEFFTHAHTHTHLCQLFDVGAITTTTLVMCSGLVISIPATVYWWGDVDFWIAGYDKTESILAILHIIIFSTFFGFTAITWATQRIDASTPAAYSSLRECMFACLFFLKTRLGTSVLTVRDVLYNIYRYGISLG